MTLAIYILLALLIGFGAAVQTGMIASIGRLRGPTEAAWISLLATACFLSIVFAARSLRGNPASLPAPFDGVLVFAAIAVLAALAMAVSLRGLDTYLAVTGLFGFAYLVSAAFLAPRIGIALFASAVTAGTLVGSVALDHWGAFGADVHRVSFMRVAGLLFLILGVVFVRSGR
jgi:transporter family-2 protein